MARRPWYPFYVDDWEQDETVKLLNNQARGVYLRLLNHQWREGSLPPDADSLASISAEPLATFRRLWLRLSGKFPAGDDGRLRNPRMQKELDRADVIRQQTNERVTRHRSNAPETRFTSVTTRSGNATQEQSQLQSQSHEQSHPHGQSPGQPQSPEPEQPQKKRARKARGTALTNPPEPNGNGVSRETWLTPYLTAWSEHGGEIDPGRLAKALRATHEAVNDPPRLAYGLSKWLLAGNAKYGPEAFARDWRHWVPNGAPKLDPSDLAVREWLASGDAHAH